MKKIVLFLVIALAAAGLSACSHEKAGEDVLTEPGQIPWGDTTTGPTETGDEGDENDIGSGGQPGTPAQTFRVLKKITSEEYANGVSIGTRVVTIEYDQEGRVAKLDVERTGKDSFQLNLVYDNGLLITAKRKNLTQGFDEIIFSYEYDASGNLKAFDERRFIPPNTLSSHERTEYEEPVAGVRKGKKFDMMTAPPTEIRTVEASFANEKYPLMFKSDSSGKVAQWDIAVDGGRLTSIKWQIFKGPKAVGKELYKPWYDQQGKPAEEQMTKSDLDPGTQLWVVKEVWNAKSPQYDSEGRLVEETIMRMIVPNPAELVIKRTFEYGDSDVPVNVYDPIRKPMRELEVTPEKTTLLYANDPALFFTYLPFL